MFKLITGATLTDKDTGTTTFQYTSCKDYPEVIMEKATFYKEGSGVLTPKKQNIRFLLSAKNNWRQLPTRSGRTVYAYSETQIAEREVTLCYPFGIKRKITLPVICTIVRRTHNTTGTILDNMFIEIPKNYLSKKQRFLLDSIVSFGNKNSTNIWQRADAVVNLIT